MIKKQKKVYIAFANRQKRNQFLVRKGRRYYLLNDQKELRKISAKEAHLVFHMITAGKVKFRGMGSFENMRKGVV